MMTPLDYGRSFLIGKGNDEIDNEVRFWVESRTRIIDEQTGVTEDYIQCASCKSEDTFAECNLFYEDNYDFLPIFGPEYGLVFRRKAWLNPNYRDCQKVKSTNMWGGQTYHLVEAAPVEELCDVEAILSATYAFKPVTAQTEITNGETGLRAIIEYPVKTLNTSRQRNIYQVDTGPVAWPDLSRRVERLVDTLSLAFVAFNVTHFADFNIEEPTPAKPLAESDDQTPQVYHYSRSISLPATNRLYAQS